MSGMDHDEELELLLAFQSVPETPPASPSTTSDSRGERCHASVVSAFDLPSTLTFQGVSCYDSGDEELNKNASMDVFRDVVQSSYSKLVDKHSIRSEKTRCHGLENRIDIETNTGLRIKDRIVSGVSLSNLLSDIRFIPLQAMSNAAMGEKLSGLWATIGVLAEKGTPKICSTGKTYAIWKISSLDRATVSLFVFGDAYKQHYKESAGTIVAVLNSRVRHDAKRHELSLSVFAGNQLIKLGTSVDYSVCKGSRKDGTSCTAVVNRRHGEYCQHHAAAMQQKYKSRRAELKGGNLKTGFYMKQKPCIFDTTIDMKLERPVKHVSLKGLKSILSNAEGTIKHQSQGIRCLASFTNENIDPKLGLKRRITDGQVSSRKRSYLDEDVITSSASLEKRAVNEDHELIELELDEERDDHAMVQALAVFGKGGFLQETGSN